VSLFTDADRRTVSLLDGVAVFWVVFWLAVGLATGAQMWQLTSLSDTAEVSATAVDSAGEALESLGQLPLVGETPGELGAEVRAAAAEIAGSAQQTREDVRRLAVLLGLAVFLIPISPVLGLYLPLRLRRGAHVAAIRRELSHGHAGRAFDAYLAHRAVSSMRYGELLAVSDDPAADLAAGRHRALADAELDRLGLTRPR
jgi:hypothetical protein